MSLGLGSFNILPPQMQAPASQAMKSLSKGAMQTTSNNLAQASSQFTLPNLTTETNGKVISDSALLENSSGLLKTNEMTLKNPLENKLDALVSAFVKEMEKKTGLSPEALVIGISQSLKKLPDTEQVLNTFTHHVLNSSSTETKDVEVDGLKDELRSFFKDVQTIIRGSVEEDQIIPKNNKNYEFEVITSSEARDRRTHAMVDRVQKDFFANQEALAQRAPVTSSPLRSFQGEGSPLANPVEKGLSTDDFFKVRQQEGQLLQRLQKSAGVPGEAEKSTLSLANGAPKVTDAPTAAPVLDFSEAWLDQVQVSGPVAKDASGEIASLPKSMTSVTSPSLMMPDTNEPVQNLHEIIQSAKMAARNGGGDMEIELKPEGLGKVQLKVSVVGDQVQVQMIAESKKVQDILQEGLQDLRAQLATQKLNAESIRVETPQDASNSQFNSKEGESANRDFAQGFMNQFREEQGAARRNLGQFPDPSLRTDRSTDVVQPLSTRARTHEGRLNLIA